MQMTTVAILTAMTAKARVKEKMVAVWVKNPNSPGDPLPRSCTLQGADVVAGSDA
jgi:hypothetical protein